MKLCIPILYFHVFTFKVKESIIEKCLSTNSVIKCMHVYTTKIDKIYQEVEREMLSELKKLQSFDTSSPEEEKEVAANVGIEFSAMNDHYVTRSEEILQDDRIARCSL